MDDEKVLARYIAKRNRLLDLLGFCKKNLYEGVDDVIKDRLSELICFAELSGKKESEQILKNKIGMLEYKVFVDNQLGEIRKQIDEKKEKLVAKKGSAFFDKLLSERFMEGVVNDAI